MSQGERLCHIPKSISKSVRASFEEWDSWYKAAGTMRFNDWAKRALNEAAALQAALDREKDANLTERRKIVAKTSAGKCQTPKGQFCYIHAVKHD